MTNRFLGLLLVVLSAACEPTTPTMDTAVGLPFDSTVYTIRGMIVADVSDLTRQIAPAQAWAVNGYATFSGPVIDGKSFIRVQVRNIEPSVSWVERDQIVILKVVDTKATALYPGDTLTFKCRRQYEPLFRAKDEAFDQERLATWEIDYCRLETGVILVQP